MKTLLTLLALNLASYSLSAQTIGNDWKYEIGQFREVMVARAEDLSRIDVGPEGENQLWNFGLIRSRNEYRIDFIAASEMDPTPATPTYDIRDYGNIGWIDKRSNYGVIYNTEESNRLSYIGKVNSAKDDPIFFPSLIDDFIFPLSYGKEFYVENNSFRYTELTQPGLDSIRIIFSFDAIGTLITPDGTYGNVFRVKSTTYFKNEIIEGKEINTKYSWYKESLSNELAFAEINQYGYCVRFEWKKEKRNTNEAIENETQSVGGLDLLRVKQNQRTTDPLFIYSSLPLTVDLKLYSSDGKFWQLNNELILKNENEIALSRNISAGIHVLKITDTISNKSKAFKIMVYRD